MIVLLVIIVVGLVALGIIETVTTCELGSPISDKDISDYLDRIESENLINGITLRWNDKYVLNIKGYTSRHHSNPSIYQTQHSIVFPYHITDVGVIPIWSKSYSKVKKLFKDDIENSTFKSNKRKKLGLE